MKKWDGIELEVGRIYKRRSHSLALCLSGLKKRGMANCSPDPTQRYQLNGAGVGLKEDTMDTVLPDLTQTAHMWPPAKPTGDTANCSHTAPEPRTEFNTAFRANTHLVSSMTLSSGLFTYKVPQPEV